MNLKIIVGILVGLIVLQIIGALIFFNLPAKKGSATPISQSANQLSNVMSGTASGKIALLGDKSSVKVGEMIAVSIMVDTGSAAVEGVDVSLKYDPKFVEPILVNQQAFVPGRLFSDTPFNAFNLNAGTASMSAISSLSTNFSGSGTLAVISFKAKSTGSTTIQVIAAPNNTVDSNMVAQGKEILGKTEDLELTIN